ncbi:hypothetical protein MATL_G00193620 [Megalops atlanticus]|uniref:Uncharacterized protein n=1 Tax=Megalops atlanticus TaxID=7932 RepID=A0A9D3PNW9_MEGAT|nr:hypothetical protein MATL_G00193620 [Megalops atlanticus]
MKSRSRKLVKLPEGCSQPSCSEDLHSTEEPADFHQNQAAAPAPLFEPRSREGPQRADTPNMGRPHPGESRPSDSSDLE